MKIPIRFAWVLFACCASSLFLDKNIVVMGLSIEQRMLEHLASQRTNINNSLIALPKLSSRASTALLTTDEVCGVLEKHVSGLDECSCTPIAAAAAAATGEEQEFVVSCTSCTTPALNADLSYRFDTEYTFYRYAPNEYAMETLTATTVYEGADRIVDSHTYSYSIDRETGLIGSCAARVGDAACTCEISNSCHAYFPFHIDCPTSTIFSNLCDSSLWGSFDDVDIAYDDCACTYSAVPTAYCNGGTIPPHPSISPFTFPPFTMEPTEYGPPTITIGGPCQENYDCPTFICIQGTCRSQGAQAGEPCDPGDLLDCLSSVCGRQSIAKNSPHVCCESYDDLAISYDDFTISDDGFTISDDDMDQFLCLQPGGAACLQDWHCRSDECINNFCALETGETFQPTSSVASREPSAEIPSVVPQARPQPTIAPTKATSEGMVPTTTPTSNDTDDPRPTWDLSLYPTAAPSLNIAVNQTMVPSINGPSSNRTLAPTRNSTATPTFSPSFNKTLNQTFAPTSNYTTNPTWVPSLAATTSNGTMTQPSSSPVVTTEQPTRNVSSSARLGNFIVILGTTDDSVLPVDNIVSSFKEYLSKEMGSVYPSFVKVQLALVKSYEMIRHRRDLQETLAMEVAGIAFFSSLSVPPDLREQQLAVLSDPTVLSNYINANLPQGSANVTVDGVNVLPDTASPTTMKVVPTLMPSQNPSENSGGVGFPAALLPFGVCFLVVGLFPSF